MNRFRKPWSLSRRDTDGAQVNATDEAQTKYEDTDNGYAEKKGEEPKTEPIDHEHGHLQEIEVDLNHVVNDREIKDIDDDTSPYPEGKIVG